MCLPLSVHAQCLWSTQPHTQDLSSLFSTLTTSDVSRRKWLIPGAEYSIFTGQPLALQDRRAENPLEEICVPG